MEILATLLGGLGLFFIGIKAIGQNLQSLAGPRMRRAVAGLTRGPLSGAAAGLLLGMLTQSTNAVTFIAATMHASGLVTTQRALPVLAWASLGTAGLVLLASFDLRLAALLILGVAGCVAYFNLDGGGRWRAGLQALVGLGMLFLGLGLLKLGASSLSQWPLVAELVAFAASLEAAGFALGIVVTLVAQSSSTVSILAITLHEAGLLSFGQAMMLILGASAGSGLATYALAAGLRGTQRQLVLYQLWLRLLGTVLFLALHIAELLLGIALLQPWLAAFSADPGIQLALFFALVQLASAVLAAPFNAIALRLLLWRVPESASESLARPQYLFDRSLDDADSALVLVQREQDRLAERLAWLLDPVRDAAPPPPLPTQALSQAGARVEAVVDECLLQLLAKALGRETLTEAVRLQARLRLLRDLRLAVTELAEAAAQAPAIMPLVEALHLLLEQFSTATDSEGRATLLALTEDRGAMMRRLRATHADALAPDLLHRATAAFERAVWLQRSLVMLDAETPR